MLPRGAFFRPERFGSYLLESFLCSDLIGDLYKSAPGEPSTLSGPLMVKKLVAPFTADAEAISGLLKVTRELSRLTHRNILEIYDEGTILGTPFLVLEYVNGWSLFSLVGHALDSLGAIGVPSPQVALYIVREMVSGLATAHAYRDEEGNSHPLIHGGMCLQSVYVSYEGEVKLTGFGDHLAVAGRLLETATPEYMGFRAPEQIRDGVTTIQSDLFSVGVILYQLLTGRRPFGNRSAMETSVRILNAPAALPSLLRSSLSPDVNPVVMKALAKNPAQRYQRASDLHRDLDALLLNNQPQLEDMVTWIRKASRSARNLDSHPGGDTFAGQVASEPSESQRARRNGAGAPPDPMGGKVSERKEVRPVHPTNPGPGGQQTSLTKIKSNIWSEAMPKAAEMITKIPGARSLLVSNAEGMIVDSYGDPEADNTGAILSIFVDRMREAGLALGMEKLNSIVVQSKAIAYVVKSRSSGVVAITVDPEKSIRDAEKALDAELGATS